MLFAINGAPKNKIIDSKRDTKNIISDVYSTILMLSYFLLLAMDWVINLIIAMGTPDPTIVNTSMVIGDISSNRPKPSAPISLTRIILYIKPRTLINIFTTAKIVVDSKKL